MMVIFQVCITYFALVKVDDYLKVISQAFTKPWPADTHPIGLNVDMDANTAASVGGTIPPVVGSSRRFSEASMDKTDALRNFDISLEVSGSKRNVFGPSNTNETTYESELQTILFNQSTTSSDFNIPQNHLPIWADDPDPMCLAKKWTWEELVWSELDRDYLETHYGL